MQHWQEARDRDSDPHHHNELRLVRVSAGKLKAEVALVSDKLKISRRKATLYKKYVETLKKKVKDFLKGVLLSDFSNGVLSKKWPRAFWSLPKEREATGGVPTNAHMKAIGSDENESESERSESESESESDGVGVEGSKANKKENKNKKQKSKLKEKQTKKQKAKAKSKQKASKKQAKSDEDEDSLSNYSDGGDVVSKSKGNAKHKTKAKSKKQTKSKQKAVCSESDEDEGGLSDVVYGDEAVSERKSKTETKKKRKRETHSDEGDEGDEGDESESSEEIQAYGVYGIHGSAVVQKKNQYLVQWEGAQWANKDKFTWVHASQLQDGGDLVARFNQVNHKKTKQAHVCIPVFQNSTPTDTEMRRAYVDLARREFERDHPGKTPSHSLEYGWWDASMSCLSKESRRR